MNALWQDLRYGARMLVQKPGFTTIAVITLALGIGANTAIFSVVNAALLKPLPYEESGRLVLLSEHGEKFGEMSISYPNFTDWRARQPVFERIGVYVRGSYTLMGSGEPEQIRVGQVSADLFAALRVKAALGRVFTNDEDKPGAAPVVALSHGSWQQRFGGDPRIIGRTIKLSERDYTVIGVMAPGYRFPSRVEMWVPVGPLSDSETWRHRANHVGIVRGCAAPRRRDHRAGAGGDEHHRRVAGKTVSRHERR